MDTRYEDLELVEVGEASEVTQGQAGVPPADNCSGATSSQGCGGFD